MRLCLALRLSADGDFQDRATDDLGIMPDVWRGKASARMSQILPQIKSHRAMAEACAEISRKTETLSVAHLLMAMADAHRAAAEALEAGDRELGARVAPAKQPPKK